MAYQFLASDKTEKSVKRMINGSLVQAYQKEWFYKMKERAPCLLDLGYETMLTWRLRFNVDDCEIVVKSSYPKEIEIKKSKKKIHGIDIRGIFKKRKIDINRGIEIQ